MFDELKKFKGQKGHCNVPHSDPENPEFGKLVARQLPTGRLSISLERAPKFNSIGFTWSIKLDVRWEIMFEELRKFNEREGQFNVCYTDQDNSELAR